MQTLQTTQALPSSYQDRLKVESFLLQYEDDAIIAFEKPIGSPADVKELEYIAALHQSGHEEDIDCWEVHDFTDLNLTGVMINLKVLIKRVIESRIGCVHC